MYILSEVQLSCYPHLHHLDSEARPEVWRAHTQQPAAGTDSEDLEQEKVKLVGKMPTVVPRSVLGDITVALETNLPGGTKDCLVKDIT